MVYFQLSRLGYNCGYDKEECPNYPNECVECVLNHLKEMGFEINSNIKVLEMDSEEKRLQMYRDLIWQKFLDVLNIKHILLIAKKSGLPIINYPISGAGVDVNLLTGFIEANISFSESGDNIQKSSNSIVDRQFYEFQYKTFNILLKNGEFVRICLVLEDKASDSLRMMVTEFLYEFEKRYRNNILKHLNTGVLNFNGAIDYITDEFNIKLIFPMVLAHTFSPDMIESINKNNIQKAVINFAKEKLVSKPFFFINNLLYEVRNIVNIDARIILYEIYQLLDKSIIIPTTLEAAQNDVKNFQETRARRIADNELISSIITSDNSINELKEKANNMDLKSAEKLMNHFIKKGETAEKAFAYKEAQKDYEKALYLATGFNFEKDIGRISFMIYELDKKIKEMEFDYASTAGENAEKKKDYINAIRYYQQAIQILENLDNNEGIDSRLKKIQKKIDKLQKQI